MKNLWLRFLHWSYCRTGRWGWIAARRIRPLGWGVSVLAVVSAVLGTDILKSSVFVVFATSTALWSISFITVFFRSAKIFASRELPQVASVGEEVHFTVTAQNRSKHRLRAALLEEWPPNPNPTLEEFSHSPEPGEEQRNPVDRTFLFYRWMWLQEQKRGFTDFEATEYLDVEGNATAKVQLRFTPTQRGLLRFSEMRVRLPDPFGLFQRCARVQAETDPLIVLPKRYPLGDLLHLGQSRLHLGGDIASNRTGQTGDFLHLRDYRPGDPIRSLDWKSWARTGTPVVREYEDSFFPRFGLILDTTGPVGAIFEEAVSVAASFVSALDTEESLIDLLFIRDQAYRVTAGRGVAKPIRLLEALASVQANGRDSLEDLSALCKRHHKQLEACIAIFPGWNAPRAAFASQLRSQIEELHLIILGDESTLELNPPADALLLNPKNVALSLQQLNRQLARS
ncbi:MAG: DUF58 domain-containing protein [Verrucomicrobiota bacterium]